MVQHGAKVGVLPRSGSLSGHENVKKGDLSLSDQVTDGSVDYSGRPAIKSKTGNWLPCFLIFGCEVSERVAFYAISANLVTYLTLVLREDVSVAARNANNWVGMTFLTPLIGAFIAESFIGRYWTISSFSCVYFVALVLVVLSVSLPILEPPQCDAFNEGSCKTATSWQVSFFYGALYLMAIGAGGIKSCVAGFAGDQFDEGDVDENKRKMSFMNWWFVSISFGTMLSVSCLVWIQITLGWSWGYGIPAVISAIVTGAYLLGTPLYRYQKPTGSPLTRVAQVIIAAIRKWNAKLPNEDVLLYEIDDKEYLNPAERKLPHSNGFRFLDKAAVRSREDDISPKLKRTQPNPWKLCSVTQVEEVKLLIRTLPIWVTNLMFSAGFAQVGTLFLSQGTTMNRHISPTFQIPAASFPLFITATICAILPLYDKFFVPFTRRFTGNERGLTLLQRIGVGQAIATLAIVVAAVVEMKRMRVAKKLLSRNANETSENTVLPMSIFWLLPQYMLTGVGEVFISVGQMEFFYDQAPDSMRSVGTALYLSTVAMGTFLSSFLVTIVTKLTWNSNGGWIGNNLNRCHIDYFYWLLSALSAVNLLVYIASAKWYRYKQTPVPDFEGSPEKYFDKPALNKALGTGHMRLVRTAVPYDLSPSAYAVQL